MSTQRHTPSNSIETTLIEYLSNLLTVEKIGRQDNIFELGMDSVLAAMFINRVRDEFNVELSMLVVFQTPTVEALAKAVQTLQKTSH